MIKASHMLTELRSLRLKKSYLFSEVLVPKTVSHKVQCLVGEHCCRV